MLTLFEVGGRSTPPIPKIIIFLYDLSEKPIFCWFHSDFGCLEGGGSEHPSPPQIGLSKPSVYKLEIIT